MRRIVLGIGNTLCGDEALGVRALSLLGEVTRGVEVIDGGTLGLRLLPLVEECSHLLILDAVDAGKPAGTMIEMERRGLPLFSRMNVSAHDSSLQEILALARVRGRLPSEITILGIQPDDVSCGNGLSAAVEEAMPRLIDRANEIISSWGVE